MLLLLGWSVLGWIVMGTSSGADGPVSWGPADFLSGLLLGLMRVPLQTAASTALFLLALAVTYRRCPTILALGLVWSAAFLAPPALSSGPIHRYYLPQAGLLLIYALAAGIGLPWLGQAWRQTILRPSRPGE